jgi:hypothetical protein
MSGPVQILEQNQHRLAAMLSNNGPDSVVLSMRAADVAAANPSGITLASGGLFKLTWQTEGEMVWGPWFASCTASQISVYEWINSCHLDPKRLSPVRSPMDACVTPRGPDRPGRRRDPLLYAMVAQMLADAARERPKCREVPQEIPSAIFIDLEIVA